MACILFSRPNHDGQMEYLHYYSKELVNFSELEHDTINREGKDRTLELWQSKKK